MAADMEWPGHEEYELLDLPAQGKQLCTVAIRILIGHASGCEIPPPLDPGKAAIVYCLYRYGFSRRALDWRPFKWLVLRRDEGRPSSTKGAPDLPPLLVIASRRHAEVLWNPLVDYKDAACHLSHLLPRAKKYTPGGVSKRLKRAKIPPDEPGDVGRGLSDRIRLRKVIELYRGVATKRLKKQKERKNQRRREKAANASAEARSAKNFRCAQAGAPSIYKPGANDPTKLELLQDPFASKTPEPAADTTVIGQLAPRRQRQDRRRARSP